MAKIVILWKLCKDIARVSARSNGLHKTRTASRLNRSPQGGRAPHGDDPAADVSKSFELVTPPEMRARQSAHGASQEEHPEAAAHHAARGSEGRNAGVVSTMVVAAIVLFAVALFGDAIRLSPTVDEAKTSGYAVFNVAGVVYQHAVGEHDVLAKGVGERHTQRVVHRDAFADAAGTSAECQQE